VTVSIPRSPCLMARQWPGFAAGLLSAGRCQASWVPGRKSPAPTHAIRHALEIAAHNKRQEDLRADAARLAANPEYQAEIRAVREELDELRAW
jgi:hypothetical protein